MRRTIRLIVALAVMTTAFTSCKTKQKIAEVPAGANVEATSSNSKTTVAQQPAIEQQQSEVSEPVAEVTRNENFSLVEGESSALKNKYHVVVGSFSKQTNAKGLQSTLKSQGNNALIVVNEKGMYRVLIASYNDYNQAHARIKQISDTFPDAWVLVQK